jgi:predicted SprT family Zn-dependent metalloprotease
MPDNSHQITINGTLEPQLFFFVLTHELAHLIAFEKYGRRISPHGQEWKKLSEKCY